MRVGADSLAVDLLAKAAQLIGGNPSFQISTRVDAGRGMTLYIDHVAAVLVVAAAPEMVEADVVQGSAGGETGDMAPDPGTLPIRGDHHGHGVPTNQGA